MKLNSEYEDVNRVERGISILEMPPTSPKRVKIL
jgi:hypothetical protein